MLEMFSVFTSVGFTKSKAARQMVSWTCCCRVVSNMSWVIRLYGLWCYTGLIFGCVSKVVNSLVGGQEAGLHILTEDQQVAP